MSTRTKNEWAGKALEHGLVFGVGTAVFLLGGVTGLVYTWLGLSALCAVVCLIATAL